MNVKNVEKFAYIDTLRGLAILNVLMVHCGLGRLNSSYGPIQAAITKGQYGVQLFFIASACTLFMSMDKRQACEKHPYLNFFIRRFFRIAPLFYVGIIYYLWQDRLGGSPTLASAPGINLWEILSTATFTNSVSPYWINSLVPGGWTITVEMTFYLFLPLLYNKIKNLKTALWLLLGTLVGAGLFHFILFKVAWIPDHELWITYVFYSFPSQLPIFLLGIVLFYMIRDFPNDSQKNNNVVAVPGVWLLFSMLLWVHFATQIISEYFFFSVAFLLLAYSLALKPTKLIVNPFTVFIGKISFSLYLIHSAVLHFMNTYGFVDFHFNPLTNFVIRYTVLLGVSSAVAFITYRYIERPGQQVGRKIIEFIER